MTINTSIQHDRERLAESSIVKVIHVGEENPLYVPIAGQIANILATFLKDHAYMRDGQGNCGEVAAITHAVATCAGFSPRLLGGNCLNAEGRAPFGRRGGHYWVEMPDGIVIDGAYTNHVNIYRPEVVGYRMIPIIANRKAACMRKAKVWLDLSVTLQNAITTRGPNFLWSNTEAA